MGWFGTKNAINAYTQTSDPYHDKAGPGRKRNCKIPDQLIREIRALYDYRGWTISMLEIRYGLSDHQVKRITGGVTGAFLLHSESDLPVDSARACEI